jgi:hypothetical protein
MSQIIGPLVDQQGNTKMHVRNQIRTEAGKSESAKHMHAIHTPNFYILVCAPRTDAYITAQTGVNSAESATQIHTSVSVNGLNVSTQTDIDPAWWPWQSGRDFKTYTIILTLMSIKF